ncbi:hypothetical protein HNQ51_000075 [Inhella inkyongensis]|uniref:Uncharacterized protein n=1 Tax=Inhella inkyongensis TaxID=392593 RepID=A0A840RZW4_9BURK|nr:hypothetical protein [Inhella inkyongensis]MBB5202782.1 hypothetical protein [Inhella inkyongensis]
MGDPAAGIYVEFMAPDWRFAILIILLCFVALRANKVGSRLTPGQWRTLGAMFLMFVLWMATSGNGRYFIAGLVLVGPLVVMGVQCLGGSPSFRFGILMIVVSVQFSAAYLAFGAGHWALTVWSDKTEPIQQSSLRNRPANFLTITGISYSSLVPLFHPKSRWANISGQHLMDDKRLEYRALTRMLADTKDESYVVLPESARGPAKPNGEALHLATAALSFHGLAFEPQDCIWLNSRMVANAPGGATAGRPSGFWFCPIRQFRDRQAAAQQAQAELNAEFSGVFSILEESCPRYFRPNEGRNSRTNGALIRFYTSSDTRVMIDGAGDVYYKYFRAMNYTKLARVADILTGNFHMPCTKVDGRYTPPWER